MDRNGIDAAILSISSPGVRFGDGLGRSDHVALATAVNDVAHATITSHPGRFGAFANLPLPDVDAALAETERTLLRCGAVGVSVTGEPSANRKVLSGQSFASEGRDLVSDARLRAL